MQPFVRASSILQLHSQGPLVTNFALLPIYEHMEGLDFWFRAVVLLAYYERVMLLHES